ncbi:hypothetical protein OG799_17930 [Micromonospora sp. NBC_00898]|nr:hypothetical protein OG799_17930 [Micromonospora sp. NBC_00898]
MSFLLSDKSSWMTGAIADVEPYSGSERTLKYTSPPLAYAWPRSISRWISSIICVMCPVASGSTVGEKQTEHVVSPLHLVDHPLADLPPRDALLGGTDDDLVVDVGDVAREYDVVPGPLEPPPQHVKDHLAARMPDVRWRVDGVATQVHRHLGRVDRLEAAHAAGSGVVQAKTHARRGNGLRR